MRLACETPLRGNAALSLIARGCHWKESGRTTFLKKGGKRQTPSNEGFSFLQECENTQHLTNDFNLTQRIIRRLQLLRAAHSSRVKLISDNSKHAAEEVALIDRGGLHGGNLMLAKGLAHD